MISLGDEPATYADCETGVAVGSLADAIPLSVADEDGLFREYSNMTEAVVSGEETTAPD